MTKLTPQLTENLYQIKLTEHERKLLETEPGLLTILEGQEQYILELALEPVRCPACPGLICRRSAVVGGAFDMNGITPDDAYECPFCHVRLTWRMALFGGDQWFEIQPGQTVTIQKEQ